MVKIWPSEVVSDAKVWESFDALNRYSLVTSRPREKSAHHPKLVFTRLLMRVFSSRIEIFKSRCLLSHEFVICGLVPIGNAIRAPCVPSAVLM